MVIWVAESDDKKLTEVPLTTTTSIGVVKGLDEVPTEARALLPKRGALVVSGGLLSSSRRAVADLDKKTISFGINSVPNTSVYGPITRVVEAGLTNEQTQRIAAMIDDTLAANNITGRPPLPDFAIVLFLARANSVETIRWPASDQASELYDYIWGLAPADF